MKRVTKINLCLTIFLVFIGMQAHAQEKSIERVVSEKLVTKIKEGYIKDSMAVSSDDRHLAYLAVEKKFLGGVKWFVVLNGKEQMKYDSIGRNSLCFSPDSKSLAYVAISGKIDVPRLGKREAYIASPDNEMFIVVDGEEKKHYKQIGERLIGIAPDFPFFETGPPVFSPDSKRFAYAAFMDKKQFVVLDGIEGKRYDGIFKVGGIGTQKFIFDSSDSLHYLATEGNSVYIVEEIIK